jgi:alpha-1,3-rhamnosyl/mannosyltransferase
MARLSSLAPARNLRYLGELLRWAAATARACRARRREPRLTVAVDVSPCWESLTGIGWYLYRLLERLGERDDLVLRLYGPDLVALPGERGPAVAPPRGAALEPVVHRPPAPPGVALARLAERLLGWSRRLLAPVLLAADGNRLLFAPNYFPPRRFALALARGTPLVATVHDLGYRRVPWAIRQETLEELGRHLDFVWHRARLVLTDAEAVRGEILAAGLAPPERVRAVLLAPAHGAAPGAGGEAGALPAGVPGRFGLFVGTVEPRKNPETLLTAWRLLRARLPDAPPLVVCGRIGWVGEGARLELARARREGWLIHLERASEAELTALYRRAAVVALPSWYEGFGLPALEAAALGAPVVASDLPVLREVLGDAALFVPPDRPELWARRLEEVLGDEGLRAELGRRGRERAAAFDWARTAEETAAAFADAAAARPASRR